MFNFIFFLTSRENQELFFNNNIIEELDYLVLDI